MPLDPEAFADSVVQAIEMAMGPVLERVAGLEARIGPIGDLRDRLVAMETKAVEPSALSDVRERIVALETRTVAAAEAVQKELDDLNKYAARVEGYTTFLQRDVAALGERAPAETDTAAVELAKETVGLRERIAVLESKHATPAPVAERAPEDIAASLAGMLREALADVPAVKPSRKVIRDAQGAVKFEIEETK